MKRPCEECLKYAICISKKYITCELLYNYGKAYTDTHEGFWKLIHKITPKCEEIKGYRSKIILSRYSKYRGGGGITG